MSTMRIGLCGGLCLLSLSLTACVERNVKIETDPPGAIVVVNDEEVGVSPVKFSFLWYGDYDLILRKSGHETVKTHFRVKAPWYQYPPFDLITETLIIGTITDAHVLPPFVLPEAERPAIDVLVDRASAMRTDALGVLAGRSPTGEAYTPPGEKLE